MAATAEQDRHMNTLRVRLIMLSHAPTQNLSPAPGLECKHPGGDPPPGGGTDGTYWWNRYKQAADPETVIEEAERALDLALRSKALAHSPETLEQENARILEEGEGFKAEEVAYTFHCTVSRVRKVRTAADRDPEWGRPVVIDGLTMPERIIQLHTQNCSQRQIATKLGVPQSTVHRHIKRVYGLPAPIAA